MNGFQLILRSLRHYWRTHLAVVAGTAVSAAVLSGALGVGDSVRWTLQRLALARLGQTHLAITSGERLFTAPLAQAMGEALKCSSAPVLDLAGIATMPGGEPRANGIHVLGVDERFWALGSATPPPQAASGTDVILNGPLARRLGANVGDRVLLRVAKPSALSRDMALGSQVDESLRLNLRVSAILDDEGMGRFNLQANQTPPFNAYVPLELLQERASVPGRANILLMGPGPGAGSAPDAGSATAALRRVWRVQDASVELRPLADLGVIELRSDRVFLDQSLVTDATKAAPGAQQVLTYFVHEIRSGTKSTPYSMVTALDPPADSTAPAMPNPLPEKMADDQIVLTQWLADDLGASVGDSISVDYLVPGRQRQLQPSRGLFRVGAIVGTEGPGGDRHLMPDFPGLAEAESPRAWNPPPELGIDLSLIRDKDEEYWRQHRGAPKALVTLAWAQRTWANRFGTVTALRWPMAHHTPAALEETLRAGLDPASVGLVVVPVREQALRAGRQGTDFGGLFLGLSFFLVAAALLLTGLLFGLGIEQRAAEAGVLLAMGFTHGQLKRLWMSEGLALSVVGTLAGIGLGVAYTGGVLWALQNLWKDAVGELALHQSVEFSTLALASGCSILAALASMAWTLRMMAGRQVRELLAPGPRQNDPARGTGESHRAARLAVICLTSGILVLGAALAGLVEASAGIFFAVGALLLAGGLALVGAILTGSEQRGNHPNWNYLNWAGLGWLNATRRSGRSLATASILACGVFLLVSVNTFRHSPVSDPLQRDSGTGGFALWGRSTLAIHQNLQTPQGRAGLGLPEMEGFQIVPMSLREGDEASCLNLNAPQNPPILGVDPQSLASRQAFRFVAEIEPDSGWLALGANDDKPGEPVPAILDDGVAKWILKTGLGRTIQITDEAGRPLNLRIVGTLANSILQGSLVISRNQFQRHFPSISGWRDFLVEIPLEQAQTVAQAMERGLSDHGLVLVESTTRLATFTAVEHAYLTIFGVLGGLGLMLGCAGLGLLLLRNVLERRSELALMQAIGFGRGNLLKLLLNEHGALVFLGLVCGTVSALAAVLPEATIAGEGFPWPLILLILAGVSASAIFWTLLAAVWALKGDLLRALRKE